MAYFPPVITVAGLSVPTLNDIQAVILSAFQSIYGSTTYLGNDSADYQWISALALKLSDNMSLCQLAYNARSPLTAIGSDLDSILKINGLTRLSSSNSSVTLLLTGLAGTSIYSAIIADVSGILWQLPPKITIGPGGSASATAICQQGGPISAAPDTIKTPVGGFTAGWNTVTNPSAANVGTPVESDSNARARQSVSVALPSNTRLAGTIAEVKAVAGVTLTNILENQTGVTDAYGNLGHSMTAVVMGGTDLNVATAIFNNRGIGCNTIGATAVSMVEVPVTDPNSGNVMTIGFVRPVSVPIYVVLGIHGLTPNYNSTMQTNIQNAIANYLNGLQIGEEVTQSALYGVALSAMPNLLQPDFSIRSLQLGIAPSPTGTTDIDMDFWQVSSGLSANVTINAV